MTLLVTVFAAVFFTVQWYRSGQRVELCLSVPCWLYWGASLMWLVDAVYEYAELGSAYFAPEPLDMLNDLYLGLCVVALGLVIWLCVLLTRDPKGVLRESLFHSRKS